MQTFEIKNRWDGKVLFSAGGETLRDRILSACVQSPTGCMEWKLHTVRGSGRMKVNGRKQYVHRLMWEIVNGAIPEGLFVLHHCDNPACVEPSHLFVGTHADNMADRSAKGRASRRGNPRLTADQVAAIRHRLTLGARGIDLAAEYGVHPATIKRIKARRAWAQEAA